MRCFIKAVERQNTLPCRGAGSLLGAVLHEQTATVTQESPSLTTFPQFTRLSFHRGMNLTYLFGREAQRMQRLVEHGARRGGLLQRPDRKRAIGCLHLLLNIPHGIVIKRLSF